MRAGIIGCGGIGMMHAKALHVVSGSTPLQVTAVADGRSECRNRVKQLWKQAAEYEEGMDLIRDAEVDCVFICLPSYLHAEYAIAAMEHGKDVFIEKPVCLIPADMEALLLAKERTGRQAMVGQVVRWFPEYRKLKEIYESKCFGKLKSITMNRICGRPQWSFGNWFVDLEKSGSVIMDLHIHDLDFTRYLLGEPDKVSAHGTKFEDGMPNQVVTVLDYKDAFAIAEGCWDVSTALPFKSYYRACFERATVEYDGTREHAVAVYHQDGMVEYIEPEVEDIFCEASDINISDVRPYFEEDRYFINCLASKSAVEKSDLEDAVRSAMLGYQILTEVLQK